MKEAQDEEEKKKSEAEKESEAGDDNEDDDDEEEEKKDHDELQFRTRILGTPIYTQEKTYNLIITTVKKR